MKNKKAFTLIELLVVVAIIGILATIAVIALQNARAKARDARRVADVKQIQTALELFFNDAQRYPTANELISGGSLVHSDGYSTTTYIAIIPTPPSPADGSCTSTSAYSYSPTSDGASYSISYCVGGPVGALASGSHCATPAGVSDGNNCSVGGSGGGNNNGNGSGGFTCGTDNVNDIDGNVYNTVLINDQCWINSNLKTTKYSDGVNIPNLTDNSQWGADTSGSYVWYNNDYNTYANSSYGALYNFYAVDSASNGGHNLCPTGWHVPSGSEQYSLVNYLNNPGDVCSETGPATDCAGAAPKLVVGGSTGFNVTFAGLRDPGGNFDYTPGTTIFFFWSSTAVDTGNALLRYIDNLPSITVMSNNKKYGLSIRCLKN